MAGTGHVATPGRYREARPSAAPLSAGCSSAALSYKSDGIWQDAHLYPSLMALRDVFSAHHDVILIRSSWSSGFFPGITVAVRLSDHPIPEAMRRCVRAPEGRAAQDGQAHMCRSRAAVGGRSTCLTRPDRPEGWDTLPALLYDMGVDHRGGHIGVAEEVLNGGISVPRCSKWVANEWRKVWALMALVRPARRTAALIALLMTLGST